MRLIRLSFFLYFHPIRYKIRHLQLNFVRETIHVLSSVSPIIQQNLLSLDCNPGKRLVIQLNPAFCSASKLNPSYSTQSPVCNYRNSSVVADFVSASFPSSSKGLMNLLSLRVFQNSRHRAISSTARKHVEFILAQ